MDRRWILGGLAVAGGIGLVRLLTAHPKIRDDTRLLLIGDSLAVGLGPHMKQMAAEVRVPYVGKGVTGSTIQQWAKSDNLRRTLESFQPTLVLVSLGTNDAYGFTAQQVMAPTMALVQLLRATGAEVVWIGAPLLPERASGQPLSTATLAMIETKADDEGAYFFDSDPLQIPRGPDGLHPTVGGYAGWAGAIWHRLT